MTEQTTTATDLLDFIRIAVRSGNNRKAHEALCDLDSSLASGSPLPAQWPQSKELEELREEVRSLRLKNRVYLSALTEIATWREKCHEYDEDVGHDPRVFFGEEDWNMIEACARRALEP